MNSIFITLKTVQEILSGKLNSIYRLLGLSVKNLPDDQIYKNVGYWDNLNNDPILPILNYCLIFCTNIIGT